MAEQGEQNHIIVAKEFLVVLVLAIGPEGYESNTEHKLDP